MSASSINFGPVSTGSTSCGKFGLRPGTLLVLLTCLPVGSIVADASIGAQFWILGDVSSSSFLSLDYSSRPQAFMRNYYTIFDYGASRVGFATLK